MSIIAEGGSMETATVGSCNGYKWYLFLVYQLLVATFPSPSPTRLAPYGGLGPLVRERTRLWTPVLPPIAKNTDNTGYIFKLFFW